MNDNIPSWIGKTLSNRYKIEEELGQGGMSAVFKAYDPNLKRHVAIKLIHPHLTENPEFIQRFEQEAAAVAQLRHNNIVQVYDFNHHLSVYYMVMEYLVGEPLNKKLDALNKAGLRMPLADTIRIVATICDAVDYAHQRRMIHRDLKPANIILDLLGEPILMDFGIAKIVGGMVHTQTGAAIGTAAYMSPEQWMGEEVDHRADIYALGIILYEMLSGAPPFQGDSTYKIMTQHVSEPIPDIRQMNTNTPNSLVAIIEKALSKDRNDRYQTAVAMANALHTAAVHVQSPTDTLAARHLDRLSVLWQLAQDLLEDRKYADCLDKLDELKRADPDHKQQQAVQMRQDAQNRLYGRAVKQFQANKLADSANTLQELRRHAPDYPGLEQLETQINQGMALQATQNRLKSLYEEAVKFLDGHQYQQALDKWETIQREPGSFEFPDDWQVEKRAKQGVASNLYTEGLAALSQGDTNRVLSLWQQVREYDPEFPDRQNLIGQVATRREERRKRWALLWRLGGGALAVLALAAFFAFRGGGSSDETLYLMLTRTAAAVAVLPTETPQPTETLKPTATAVPPTATDTPTSQPTATAAPTNTPTAVPTNTPTTEPSPAATLDARALVLEPSSIFTGPDAGSAKVAILHVDDRVDVIGRSSNSNWLYVRTGDGDQGFVFSERVQWEGDIAALPVKFGAAPPATATSPPITGSGGPLTFNLWGLSDTIRCEAPGSAAWFQTVFMEGEGGSGIYTYFWEGEPVGGPTSDSITVELHSFSAAIIGTGMVTASDGQSTTAGLFLPNPDCP